MSYRPTTQDPEASARAHRERLYLMTLASGVANIAVLIVHVGDVFSAFLGPLLGGMCGSLIFAGIKGNTDSYYRALVGLGLRWMSFALGVLALLLWTHTETSLVELLIPAFPRLTGDAFLLALILGLFFHAGYAFAYLRDQFQSE